MANFLVTLFIVCALSLGNSFASNWNYGDEAHWSPQCHEGKQQSPIALSKDIATNASYKPLEFIKYDIPFTVYMKNNGHSAEVRLHTAETNVPEIRGGDLGADYILDHLHFHWQSEHVVDDYRFPLELHLVHFAKRHQSLANALRFQHGVAVFAILFDLSPDDYTGSEPLIKVLDNLRVAKSEPVFIQDFIVKSLVPRDTAGYFRYNGSLTTPECNEGILWTVFTNTMPISLKQAQVFHSLQTEENLPLQANYRSLQPLNERTLYLKESPIRGSAPIHLPSFGIAVFLFLNYLLLH